MPTPHRARERRIFFTLGAAIVLLAIWPALTLFNHVEPFILGLPPFVFFSLIIFVTVPALLLAALVRKI